VSTGKKYVPPYCGAEFDSMQALATRMKACKKKMETKDMGAPRVVGPEHLNIRYL